MSFRHYGSGLEMMIEIAITPLKRKDERMPTRDLSPDGSIRMYDKNTISRRESKSSDEEPLSHTADVKRSQTNRHSRVDCGLGAYQERDSC